MHVLVLAHGARGAGAVSVARNLLGAFARSAERHRYTVTFTPGYGFEAICAAMPEGHGLPVDTETRLFARWLWETRTLPGLAARQRPDVILSLADRALLRPPCPQAVLIHRPQLLYPAKHYGQCSIMERFLFTYHSRHLAKSLHDIDLVLCQTEVARKRFLNCYNFRGRTEICPNAVSTNVSVAQPRARLPAIVKANSHKKLLFCLTRYYSHKNLEILLELFSKHSRELHDVGVITTVEANQHPKASRFLRGIEELGLSDSILNVGPIPQNELAAYYDASAGLLLPTLLESFSGTYLEAMQFELPIITSDLDFAHAVCGDAAEYCDPWSSQSVCRAIRRVLDSPSRSADLVHRGNRRRSSFVRSWDSIAADLEQWLAELVG